MLRFIARRIVFIVLITVLIVFFVYMGMSMIRNSEVPEPDYDVVQYGKLAWQETRTFLSQVIKGDLGFVKVQETRVPVADFVQDAYLNSMGLLLVALFVAAIAGLYIGSLAALTKHKRLVLPLLTLTILGVSTPSFFAGLLLQQGALRYLDTFGTRLVSMGGFGWDVDHMVLPVLVLAARPLAYLTRAAFIALNRVMEEDYIRTAFSKGLSFRRTVNIHALRNIAVPVLTALGVSVRFSLSTLPVAEFFFAWPGLGLRLVQAIDARETSTVVVLAAVLGLTFLLMNLFLDIAYRIIDPRMKEI